MVFIIILNDYKLYSLNLFYFTTEVNHVNHVNHVNLVNLDLNLNLNWKLELECLDQLILVVQLPDVSVTSTNGYSYLL